MFQFFICNPCILKTWTAFSPLCPVVNTDMSQLTATHLTCNTVELLGNGVGLRPIKNEKTIKDHFSNIHLYVNIWNKTHHNV